MNHELTNSFHVSSFLVDPFCCCVLLLVRQKNGEESRGERGDLVGRPWGKEGNGRKGRACLPVWAGGKFRETEGLVSLSISLGQRYGIQGGVLIGVQAGGLSEERKDDRTLGKRHDTGTRALSKQMWTYATCTRIFPPTFQSLLLSVRFFWAREQRNLLIASLLLPPPLCVCLCVRVGVHFCVHAHAYLSKCMYVRACVANSGFSECAYLHVIFSVSNSLLLDGR
mmetsp:Transcript_15410/g.31277  ORF Transcript_15410/g.31277 Transcript_15410/m.31277 type:complete len:225 (+) Transcript_15410:685-1359(+)